MTPLYTHPQPDQTELINQLTDELNKAEAERALLTHIEKDACTVTRHEVETAMMYSEVNHCDSPAEYVLDILKRLQIEVKVR